MNLEKMVKGVFIKHFLPKEHVNESFRLTKFEQECDEILFEWTNPFSQRIRVPINDFIEEAKSDYYKSIKNNSNLNIDVIRYMLSKSKKDFLLNEFDHYNKIIDITLIHNKINVVVKNDQLYYHYLYMDQYLQFERDLKIYKILT